MGNPYPITVRDAQRIFTPDALWKRTIPRTEGGVSLPCEDLVLPAVWAAIGDMVRRYAEEINEDPETFDSFLAMANKGNPGLFVRIIDADEPIACTLCKGGRQVTEIIARTAGHVLETIAKVLGPDYVLVDEHGNPNPMEGGDASAVGERSERDGGPADAGTADTSTPSGRGGERENAAPDAQSSERREDQQMQDSTRGAPQDGATGSDVSGKPTSNSQMPSSVGAHSDAGTSSGGQSTPNGTPPPTGASTDAESVGAGDDENPAEPINPRTAAQRQLERINRTPQREDPFSLTKGMSGLGYSSQARQRLEASAGESSLYGREQHGGIAQSYYKLVEGQEDVHAPEALRDSVRSALSVLNSNEAESGPRYDLQKLSERLLVGQPLSPARREEEGREAILFMSDVSGSCEGWAELSALLGEAAGLIGVPGQDVISILHSNGRFLAYSVNGKPSDDFDPSALERENSHLVMDWIDSMNKYDELIESYNVKTIIDFSDADPTLYVIFQVTNPQIERFLWMRGLIKGSGHDERGASPARYLIDTGFRDLAHQASMVDWRKDDAMFVMQGDPVSSLFGEERGEEIYRRGMPWDQMIEIVRQKLTAVFFRVRSANSLARALHHAVKKSKERT